MNFDKRLAYLLFFVIVFSLVGKKVVRSEYSNDFIPVKYNFQQTNEDKIITLKEKSDLPELFKVKRMIKQEVRSDSVLQNVNGYRVQVYKSTEMMDSKNMESMYIEMFGEDEVKLIFL